MKLIRITLFWLIVFILLGFFSGGTIFSIQTLVFLIIINLIFYALLAKKIQKSLDMPKNLDIQPQTTDEFFTDKPQSLHDYHEQMLDNGFVLSETLFWVNNNLHYDLGIYRHPERDSLIGTIYHHNNPVSNQTFVWIEFYEDYDNNQSITVSNSQVPMLFDVSDDIIKLLVPNLTTVDELLTAFEQVNSKINAKPRPIVSVIDVYNDFYHKEKQAEINKGYYRQSTTGDYVATYKGAFCALYRFYIFTNWIYFYQRERYVKKWLDE